MGILAVQERARQGNCPCISQFYDMKTILCHSRHHQQLTHGRGTGREQKGYELEVHGTWASGRPCLVLGGAPTTPILWSSLQVGQAPKAPTQQKNMRRSPWTDGRISQQRRVVCVIMPPPPGHSTLPPLVCPQLRQHTDATSPTGCTHHGLNCTCPHRTPTAQL